ncbi:MAG: beta-lactamase family protein [Anaerolineae bacterium]|nr:MAG: beta-lactamase family protein [Anaerolineae bacterium]
MTTVVYPDAEWERVAPAEAGFNPEKLTVAKRWLDDRVGDGRYRAAIVRGGHLVAEWNHGVGRDEQLWLASAAKSIFSCILGIAVEEGKISSADAKIVGYYPEAMDVPEGEGPKPGRYAFEKDRAITFRQLIANTSGYMKPGEEPGRVFHYQTYGMNILTHAIAKIYGLYDIRDPEGSPGLNKLVDEKLRLPIGAAWGYYLSNFDLHPQARIHIFGYYDGIKASALDMARLGWLWRNWGRWRDRQLIPEAWLRQATQTAPDIWANCPPAQWKYGYAFWTNDHGQLWPHLPRDSYAASGAGSQHIWVCPSLDLVVVQSPGLWQDQAENDAGLLKLVIDACEQDS